MRRVKGKNVRVIGDSTGGFICVDWDCPYCGAYNAGFYFSSKGHLLVSDFEVDHECEVCGRMLTIECTDPIFE